MSKRIRVLGIETDNHTVRETMFLMEEYVSSEGLNFVAVVTPDMLVEASENEQTRQLLASMDLHVIGDAAILEVLEETYSQQASEIQRRDLEEVFLNMLIRRRKTAYWISDGEADVAILRDYMGEHYEKLNLAGIRSGVMDEESLDMVINDINSVAPDVILLQTAWTERMQLLMNQKNRLNAKLCICMNYRIKSKFWSPNRTSKIMSLIDQTMFKRKAIRYQEEQK